MLRKLDALPVPSRLELYRHALQAWQSSQEQREMDRGASPAQARANVDERHRAGLREGYPAGAKAERDAFLDRHVAAAVA